MIKYLCDRCGKEVLSSNRLLNKTLQAICPAEEIQVDFCQDCYNVYKAEQAEAIISVDIKFLKEMKRV